MYNPLGVLLGVCVNSPVVAFNWKAGWPLTVLVGFPAVIVHSNWLSFSAVVLLALVPLNAVSFGDITVWSTVFVIKLNAGSNKGSLFIKVPLIEIVFALAGVAVGVTVIAKV